MKYNLTERMLEFAVKVFELGKTLPKTYWLKFIIKAKMQKEPESILPLLNECKELILIIGKSIVTAKTNQNKK